MQLNIKQRLKSIFNLSGVAARFPFPALFMAIFTLIIMIEGSFRDETLARILGGIVIAAYLGVSIVLAAESKGRRPSALLQLAIFAVITALAWFSKQLHLNIPMAIGAAILLLGNAVIWRQNRDDLHVWDFTHKLWTGAGFAAAGSIIYTWGIFAIMAALNSLFGVKIDDLMQHVLLPIGLGFFAPVFWLASLPPVDEDYSDLYEDPGFVSKSVGFLGSWLLSPLTLIYALILLAYGVKIVLASELPNGEIARLTSPFLIIGTLTWLALEPPFISKKTLANVFRKLWWLVSIPAALLLAVAVFVRIGEYGFTPERLALLALVVWSLGLAIWFTFAPKLRRDIRFIPGAAAVLLAVGAVGSGWFSLVNQGHRFENSLKAAVVISDEGRVTDVGDMDAARRAKGALNYLMRYDGQARVKRILSNAAISFESETFSFSDVLTLLNFDDVTLPNVHGRSNYIGYESDNRISTVGFDAVHGPFGIYSGQSHQSFEVLSDELKLISHKGDVSIKSGAHSLSFNLAEWLKAQELIERTPEHAGVKSRIENPYIHLLDTTDVKVALYIKNFNGWKYRDSNEADNFSAEFYILTSGLD